MTSTEELLKFRKKLQDKKGVNWGLANTPERFRIDPDREYTSNEKEIIGLQVVLYNSNGNEVTYPVKGSVVVRRKPWKTEYRLWTLDGRSDCVHGTQQEWDLMPADDQT